MAKPIDSETAEWVDRQVAAALQPAAELAPDTEHGLRRLRRSSAERQLQRRRQMSAAVGLTIAMALAIALPPTRVYATRCIEACVEGGQFVLTKLLPNQKRLSVSHQERSEAPDFALEDAAGELVRLSEHKGQVVLLNFWATWCNPCRLEVPWFIEFQRTYGPEGFTVIGVSLDEDGWMPVLPYLAEQGVNYPVVLGKIDVLQAYGGLDSIPTTLIIDRRGRVAATHLGLVSKSVYERDIVAALHEAR
jgi:thiol-disulfide isomerase/thioredoxin